MAGIRVLIVDDSALIRKMLTEILAGDPEIEVVGTAPDPYVAREKIKQLKPDVLTLDVQMPKMDGVSFLKNLMRLRPMPVVMISNLTEAGADITLKALELGAVDYLPKPDRSRELADYAAEIIAKVKVAAAARVSALQPVLAGTSSRISFPSSFRSAGRHDGRVVIGIGASTGGTEAIKCVLAALPSDCPAVLITQHLPAAFSESFALHADAVTALRVGLASEGQSILPGTALIAPGEQHLRVVREGGRYVCRLDDGPPVNRHKPAVDVMFRSMAEAVGGKAVSVLLTGMGIDGARGMEEMHQAGAATIVQDRDSSVVWGMPGEAHRRGCADHVLPLGRIAGRILELIGEKR